MKNNIIDWNNIGSEGVKQLTKINMPLLEKLSMSKHLII
jgi:hypothetical protein